MICLNCKTEAPEGKKFCGECGVALIPPEAAGPVAVPGEDGTWFCTRHTKAVTRLRCGRCEAPICPKCTICTPAGTRCRACSKNKIAVRPAGLLHGALGVVEGASGGGRRVWYLALWYLLLSFLRNPFGW